MTVADYLFMPHLEHVCLCAHTMCWSLLEYPQLKLYVVKIIALLHLGTPVREYNIFAHAFTQIELLVQYLQSEFALNKHLHLRHYSSTFIL